MSICGNPLCQTAAGCVCSLMKEKPKGNRHHLDCSGVTFDRRQFEIIMDMFKQLADHGGSPLNIKVTNQETIQ